MRQCAYGLPFYPRKSISNLNLSRQNMSVIATRLVWSWRQVNIPIIQFLKIRRRIAVLPMLFYGYAPEETIARCFPPPNRLSVFGYGVSTLFNFIQDEFLKKFWTKLINGCLGQQSPPSAILPYSSCPAQVFLASPGGLCLEGFVSAMLHPTTKPSPPPLLPLQKDKITMNLRRRSSSSIAARGRVSTPSTALADTN